MSSSKKNNRKGIVKTVTKTVTTPPLGTPSRRRRRRRSRGQNGQVGSIVGKSAMLRRYADLLNDPFSVAPVKLGFGTMVPTTTATLYWRGILTTASDGTLSIAVFPGVNGSNCGVFSNAGLFTTGVNWAQNQWANSSAVTGMGLQQIRFLGMGLRAYTNSGLNIQPGIWFVGSVPSTYPGAVTAQSASQLVTLPALKPGVTRTGARAVSRPQDNSSYEFTVAATPPSGYLASHSIPMIVIQNSAGASSIYVEAVCHIEGIEGLGSETANIFGESTAPEPGLSDWFPSTEQLFKAVWPSLKDAGVFNYATNKMRDFVEDRLLNSMTL